MANFNDFMSDMRGGQPSGLSALGGQTQQKMQQVQQQARPGQPFGGMPGQRPGGPVSPLPMPGQFQPYDNKNDDDSGPQGGGPLSGKGRFLDQLKQMQEQWKQRAPAKPTGSYQPVFDGGNLPRGGGTGGIGFPPQTPVGGGGMPPGMGMPPPMGGGMSQTQREDAYQQFVQNQQMNGAPVMSREQWAAASAPTQQQAQQLQNQGLMGGMGMTPVNAPLGQGTYDMGAPGQPTSATQGHPPGLMGSMPPPGMTGLGSAPPAMMQGQAAYLAGLGNMGAGVSQSKMNAQGGGFGMPQQGALNALQQAQPAVMPQTSMASIMPQQAQPTPPTPPAQGGLNQMAAMSSPTAPVKGAALPAQ